MKLYKFITKIYGKKVIINTFFCSLITISDSLFQILLTWMLGSTVNAIGEGLNEVFKMFNYMVCLLFILIVTTALRVAINGITGSIFSDRLRFLYGKTICYSQYINIEKEKEGELLTMATSDIETLQVWLLSILSFMEIPLKILLPLVLMFSVNIKLSCIMILLMILSLLPTIFLSSKLNNNYLKEKEAYSLSTGFINVVMDFYIPLKAYKLETYIIDRNNCLLNECLISRKKRQLREQIIWTLGRCLSIIVIPIVLIFAGTLILNGTMSFGYIFSFVLLAKIAAEGLNLLYEYPPKYQAAKASMLRLERMLNAPFEIQSKKEKEFVFNSKIVYCIKDLNFAFNDNIILKNISFTIQKGERIAIIGPSGGGKSTLFKLMEGLYTVDESVIFFNNYDITTIPTDVLRNNLSVVTQESFVFSGTFRENLLLSKKNADDQEIRDACKQACIDDFIMKQEKGYDTPIVGIKNSLSKGQIQRLNIARAFLRNSSVWLLDEPFSAIDIKTADIILNNIMLLRKDKTVIVIMHDLGKTELFDRVIKIEGGLVQ